MTTLFTWRTFDVRSMLPEDWDTRILGVAAAHHRVKALSAATRYFARSPKRG